jgi:hypothetical protein
LRKNRKEGFAMSIALTVFFEDPFWVGVVERARDGRYEVCRIVFGAEPTNAEIFALLNARWNGLHFGAPLFAPSAGPLRRPNPKRMQRLARKQTAAQGVGTKAQEAMKRNLEQTQGVRKARARKLRQEDAARQFAIRQDKRKQKHRGR